LAGTRERISQAEQHLRRRQRRRGVHDLVGEARAAKIGDDESGVRGADVNAPDECVAGVELHQGRAPAAARRGRPEIGDDAGANEMRRQGADGGRRQAGCFDELRAGERPRAIDRNREHAIDVQPAEVCRMPRAEVLAALSQ
jgi:hypothetical protein